MSITKQLFNKFYLFSLGLYLTVLSIFLSLYIFQNILNLNQLLALYLCYFITVFWRTFYEQLVIRELKCSQLNIKNNFILAFISALVMLTINYCIKEPLGVWSIPVTVIISMKLMENIKKMLWPGINKQPTELLTIYSEKLKSHSLGTYAFFIGIAMITIQSVKHFGMSNFPIGFAIAVFVSLFIEQIYEFKVIYEIKLKMLFIFLIFANSILFSLLCVVTTLILMQNFNLSGKLSTIAGLLILKLIQPLLFKIILSKGELKTN